MEVRATRDLILVEEREGKLNRPEKAEGENEGEMETLGKGTRNGRGNWENIGEWIVLLWKEEEQKKSKRERKKPKAREDIIN